MLVSGLEPLLAVTAPKVLTAAATAILTKVAPKVAGSVTFRFRIYLRVRRVTKLHPPMRLYLKWLRDAAKADLREPLEAAGAQLATTLDEALSADWKWRIRTDRRSAALRLVEETYPAILTLMQESDARALEEEWAGHRHEALLAALSGMNPLAGFNRADAASLLLRESHNRRLERLRSFNLNNEQIAGLVALMAGVQPDVPAGTVVTLVGSFGAGKSEQAESWFALAAAAYRDTEDAPIPMWFHASALAAIGVHEAVRRQLHSQDMDLKAAIVIDGLDEIDPDVASQVAKQTRVLVATHSASSALMTIRPGVLPPDDTDVFCRGLDDAEVETLVNLVAGDPVHTGGWNADLLESVRRPFFAIAFGQAYRDDISGYGQANMIRHLVERALEDPATKKSAVQHSEVYQSLENLALHLTETGSKDDGLSYATRQQALRSRLLREVNGHAEFTLPIFQQWFAAQALLANPERVDRVAADPVLFGRWRWALAVAGSAAPNSVLDDLLRRCIRANAGAGAWVQKEIASGYRGWRDQTDATPEAVEVESRLLLAARTWVDGLGHLAPSTFPIQSASDPITLGVRIDHASVSLGWSSELADKDRFLDIPHDVHLSPSGPWQSNHVRIVIGNQANRVRLDDVGNHWPWQLVLEQAENGIRGVLRTGVLGPVDGVWREERRHQLVRELTDTRSMLFPPVDRDIARDVVAAILARVPDQSNTEITLLNGRVAHGREILDLNNWLATYPFEQIMRPLATPDVPNPPKGRVWDMYSPTQLQQFMVEMLGRACTAYDEAATIWFPSFGWSLGTGEPGKFGVLSELVHYPEANEYTPVMSMMVVPLPLLEEEVERQGAPFVKSSNGRAAVATTRVKQSRSEGYLHRLAREWWREGSPRFRSSGPFAELTYTTRTPDMMHHERPASEIAVGWLWHDLGRLGLVSGSAPKVR